MEKKKKLLKGIRQGKQQLPLQTRKHSVSWCDSLFLSLPRAGVCTQTVQIKPEREGITPNNVCIYAHG